MIYLDTSALTKLVVDEAETPDLRAWLGAQGDRGETAVTSALGRVELMRAVARVAKRGLRERALFVLDGLDVLPITPRVIALAESIGPATLRSLDAIHLAAASQIKQELTVLVTYDHRLLEGCHDVDLPTASPGAAGEARSVTAYGARRQTIAAELQRRAARDDEPEDPDFQSYPWVVWTVDLFDPSQLAGDDVAQRTSATATEAARQYGCVYEYCVDEDSVDDVKYYRWYVGLTQAEHQHRIGAVPLVVAELIRGLIDCLPEGVDVDSDWLVVPDMYATRQRNESFGGYPDRD